MHAWPMIEIASDELLAMLKVLAPRTSGVGLEQVGVQGTTRDNDGRTREVRLRMTTQAGTGLSLEVTPAPREPLQPLDAYAQLMIRAARRDTAYPYELIRLLLRSTAEGDSPAGEHAPPGAGFTEYDLDSEGRPYPVDRPHG